ncbi:DUF4279 domain-containing protein [Spirilliplanes yamanashiensis]|uniref:DUF4279 domain-containing protein n=1 Tax=Spirilliplanes yamanashiensis TaxID=42233 RepID=A0A8J3Y5U6_9ACTN|nr:DUF4279 domain-containing protein [Spirilliplanes yamanashiensis]MDP9814659.1 hypothetical protein [Spirilliplanes yamanashiensis]GIJ02313.1 hypothetical protein Sya03_16650 [Spirilliplanes yamanashiensis]
MSGSDGVWERPPRYAGLVIFSRRLTPAQITAVLGVQPDYCHATGDIPRGLRHPRPARDAVWAIEEVGDAGRPLSAVVEAAVRRAVPLRSSLRELAVQDPDVGITLDVVHTIGPDDEGGLGFGLLPDQVAFLADVGALLDVDQYRGW